MGVQLSVNLGGKCSILAEDLFFFLSSPEFGEKKCSTCIFLLVFVDFPHLNKIVVEVHPPMLKIDGLQLRHTFFPPKRLDVKTPLQSIGRYRKPTYNSYSGHI